MEAEEPEQSPSPPEVATPADGSQVAEVQPKIDVDFTGQLPTVFPAEMLRGLAHHTPRALGSEGAARLAASMANEMAYRIEKLEIEVGMKSESVLKLSVAEAGLKERVDTLQKANSDLTRYASARSVLSAVGTFLFGLGLDQMKNGPAVGVPLVLIGVVALWVGFVGIPGGRKK